MGMDPKKSK